VEDNTFFMVMFSIGAFMALVTLGYVLRRAFSRQGGEIGGWELGGAGRRIAAVARTTLAEGIRAKTASGFALLILVSLPFFYLTAEGDGTIKGRVQMFMSYSLGFTSFILALLTVFFACRSLSVEIASRQIYSIVSKPIARWQIVMGKWTGVMVMNACLLLIATAATYAGSRAIVSGFKRDLAAELSTKSGLTPAQAASLVESLDRVSGIGKPGIASPIVEKFAETLGFTTQQVFDLLLKLSEPMRVNLRRYDEVRRQVLVSRAAIAAELPDFTKFVDERYNQLREEGRLPEGWTEQRTRDQILQELGGMFCTVPRFEGRQFVMKGPPPRRDPSFVMSIRFKIQNLGGPSEAVEVGGRTLEENTILCVWGIGDPTKPSYLETLDAFPINSAYEVEIPVQSVGDDGAISVVFQNMDPRNLTAVFNLEARDLEVLYRVGTFETGLVQVWLATMIPLACLAAIAVAASTFLSFPVGALICVTIYIISCSTGFLAEALAVTKDFVGIDSPGLAFEIRRMTVDSISWVMALGDVGPVDKLIDGRAVGWAVLWDQAWKFVLLKGTLAMLIGVFTLRRREIAAVIV